MTVDLDSRPYFEIEPCSRIEVFINGRSRLVANIAAASRFYSVFLPEENPVDFDIDNLPF